MWTNRGLPHGILVGTSLVYLPKYMDSGKIKTLISSPPKSPPYLANHGPHTLILNLQGHHYYLKLIGVLV